MRLLLHFPLRPLAAMWLTSLAVQAQPLWLKPDGVLSQPQGGQARQRPIVLRADRLSARPDFDALAEGHVEYRRAGTVIRADRLHYDVLGDLADARGNVRIERDNARFWGPQLQLQVQRFEGFFLQPEFEFPLLGSGGRAARVDFLDHSRARLSDARYSSCPREGPGEPDWLLRTTRIHIDQERNEGLAEGAVLQFLGVPILGLPVLSFPLSDERKSGWLPPNIALDNRSGFEFGVPYYWNIAPNRDATITPTLLTRRGLAANVEWRYLEPADRGRLVADLLPRDRVADRARHAWQFEHEGQLRAGLRYQAAVQRVSDDAFWEDFPRWIASDTPRLLNQQLRAEWPWQTAVGPVLGYARVQHWQVLSARDTSATIVAPYQRSPQLGVRLQPRMPGGLQAALETELNRFTRPTNAGDTGTPASGWRWHAAAQVSRPWREAGWWFAPKFSLNAARYATDRPMDDGRTRAGRVVPSVSVDAGLVFERASRWFGREQRQTLEPRLLYVNTAYRDQSQLPLYDTGARDFNTVSLFSETAYAGIDRIADAHQVTIGAVTRWRDALTGAETLRLGAAQRLRLRDQRVTLGESADALTERVSDLLLEGSTSLVPHWQFDAGVQYNPDSRRAVRSNATVVYTPGPFRTLSASYLFARGLSEQLSLGWQWPVYRGTARPMGAAGGCGGTWYAVGRVNYSMADSRVTGSIVGAEYDAGCWIGRIVVERQSTSSTQSTTRLMLQLELSGLSRLGSNPLQVLKDNIPGYRLLRESPLQASTDASLPGPP
ncbi:MAG: LPS assembly protein LptD [Aquabacterium sp.]|nr:LPS assembly protein LptD [Aquabacterium sp.]